FVSVTLQSSMSSDLDTSFFHIAPPRSEEQAFIFILDIEVGVSVMAGLGHLNQCNRHDPSSARSIRYRY
ncbi:hypothetical protein EVAR_90590_1, partial [Eumeta japonica]